ncbi:MAG: hypothetical protein JWQ23_627 [Herminiimonas sp.]|nr:hypothetical protein [Herminiimonas sp.]
MNAVKPDIKRRTFLTAAACAPAIAVAALLTRWQGAEEAIVPSAPDNAAGSVGYHETDHIRKYYRSAAFY